jgi:phosphoribosylglycinamide formyltransferase 1
LVEYTVNIFFTFAGFLFYHFSINILIMSYLAIFASGSGTNAQAIINYFKNGQEDVVKLILSNNPEAYVLQRAKNLNIPSIIFNKDTFYNTQNLLQVLEKENIELIILAGFLWLIPEYLIKRYPNRIINIHPALLPKYGGKGMYGQRVHQAVIDNHDAETGISIHYVNEVYDEGKIIFQAKCKVDPADTAETIANKVHKLEYEHYPKVIEKLLKEMNN